MSRLICNDYLIVPYGFVGELIPRVGLVSYADCYDHMTSLLHLLLHPGLLDKAPPQVPFFRVETLVFLRGSDRRITRRISAD